MNTPSAMWTTGVSGGLSRSIWDTSPSNCASRARRSAAAWLPSPSGSPNTSSSRSAARPVAPSRSTASASCRLSGETTTFSPSPAATSAVASRTDASAIPASAQPSSTTPRKSTWGSSRSPSGGAPPEGERLDPQVDFLGVVDEGWADAGMAEASVRLATALVAAGEGENVVVSPLSLQLALAVLREGATGRAAERLDEVLGLPDGDGSQAVADLRALLAQFEGDVSQIDRDNPPETPVVHIADGVFIQPGYPVEAEFLERAAAYHRAQVYEADFAAGQAKPLLDAWVERETGGLLTEAPAEPARDTLLTLLNAVTFAASWRSPFAPEGTRDDSFTLADGTIVEVPMMADAVDAGYAEGAGWRAVQLPYTEGFAMQVVLPDVAIEALGTDRWQEVRGALVAAPEVSVDLRMPRWEMDAGLDLTALLSDLGLDVLRAPDGDLDGIFSDAYVSRVAQAATITVAERGTVAAAVTQVEVEATSAPLDPAIELVLDHPFEYQVVELQTGLVLFAGRVADPSA